MLSCVVYEKRRPSDYWYYKQQQRYEILDKAMNAPKDSSSSGPFSLGWIRDPISGLSYANDFHTFPWLDS
jgi:hypothetical protein